MSKRRKTKRQAKLEVSRAAKRRFLGAAVVYLAAAVVLALGFWWWKFKPAGAFLAANPISAESNNEFQKLKGRWQRPDGAYRFEVKFVTADGAMDAGYFNPKSIHIAKAEAFREADATKDFVELRASNYPGSTYTLYYYDPQQDQLWRNSRA
jgi:hypothetical protein